MLQKLSGVDVMTAADEACAMCTNLFVDTPEGGLPLSPGERLSLEELYCERVSSEVSSEPLMKIARQGEKAHRDLNPVYCGATSFSFHF